MVVPAVNKKCVLLGEAAVGKSSLVSRFVSNDFKEDKEPTIGAAFMSHRLTLGDGSVVKFEIWDTAGQERFHSLAPMYYRNASAAVVVYDVTSQTSFEKAKNWINELQRQANPNIVIALTGNKLDLVQDRRVSRAVAEEFAARNGLLFFEASAKTGENVKAIFQGLGEKLPKEDPATQQQQQQGGSPYNRSSDIRLDGILHGSSNKSGCC